MNARTGKLWRTYTALREQDSNLLNTSESRTFWSCHLGVITMLRDLVQPLLPFFRPWLRAQLNWPPCSWTNDTHNRCLICCMDIKKFHWGIAQPVANTKVPKLYSDPRTILEETEHHKRAAGWVFMEKMKDAIFLNMKAKWEVGTEGMRRKILWILGFAIRVLNTC